MSSIIPYDVVEDILLRLPIESLVRFRFVNRFLCSLIENPTFLSKQRRARGRCSFDHAVILLPGRREEGRRNSISFLESTGHEIVNWDGVANESCPSMLDGRSLRIVGHCNGLICFSSRRKGKLVFSLWNPFLRQHRSLPASRHRAAYLRNDYFGFGHDPQSQDYKIVRLALYYEKFDEQGGRFTQAEVYSLRTNSWGPVARAPPELESVLDRCVHGRVGVCSGGFCYWVVRGRILSFGLSSEVFRLLGVPQLLFQNISHSRPSGSFVAKAMVWNEAVCVVVFPRDNTGAKRVYVWVLGRIDHSSLDPNYTVPVEKFSTIRLDGVFIENNLYPKLFWNDDIVSDLFRSCGATWNLKTQQIKYISMSTNLEEDLKSSTDSNFQISGYIKSFVSLY